MKKVAPALLSMALIAASTSAMAEGESVDLTVTGSVVPSACVPVLDNGGKLDWGTIPSSALSEAVPYELEDKDLKLTVTCAAPTQFGLQIVDNRAASAKPDPESRFRGLGFAGSAPLGSYTLLHRELLADGNPAALLRSLDDGATWAPVLGQTDPISSVEWIGLVTAEATAPFAPVFATKAVLNLKARGYISPKNELPIGEVDIKLDGSSTFEIKYL